MIVLGIESSCDETAAALLKDGHGILSSVIASQVATHSGYGGVVPELASREHIDNISFVVHRCLEEAKQNGASLTWRDIDGIAATRGPGLVGALLVGMAYAKALAYARGVPFVGVNHIEGHMCSIFLDYPEAELPALSLVVSGGHTSLFYMQRPMVYRELAKTRDAAAGEALDKLAKLLGLGYPGGPMIDRLATRGNPMAVSFAMPKISDHALDFSFSGIKTAALRYARENEIPAVVNPEEAPQNVLDLLASYQSSIVDQLLNRLERALEDRDVRSIHISGGVSCNSELRRRSREFFRSYALPVYYPRPSLTTDNAVMIAAAGSLRLREGQSDSWDLPVDPNLTVNVL